MSFKNGGLKTKFVPPQYSGGPSYSYTIYAALESVSDMMCYAIFDDKTDKEVDLNFGSEDDCAYGQESLIDVMYMLKYKGVGIYPSGKSYCHDIVIEEMTNDEMDKAFGNSDWRHIKHIFLDDMKPFTIKWLSDNIDLESKQLKDYFVSVSIEDNSTDSQDIGHVEIVVGEMYWSLIKSMGSEEWLCTLWDKPDTDSWIPSVKTIEDFKRLFRVATGFDLPYKNERT